MIVDEFTGRTMPGRRWSDGLHQAVEAKEKLTIQAETVTLASISYQNFFRTFPKLAGKMSLNLWKRVGRANYVAEIEHGDIINCIRSAY